MHPICKEHAVASAGIDVIVAPLGGHEANVGIQERIPIKMPPVRDHAAQQQPFQGRLERAFPGFQAMVVVVGPALEPELPLPVANHVPNDLALVTASSTPAGIRQIHDGAGKRGLGRLVVRDGAKILLELPCIVVPMRRTCLFWMGVDEWVGGWSDDRPHAQTWNTPKPKRSMQVRGATGMQDPCRLAHAQMQYAEVRTRASPAKEPHSAPCSLSINASMTRGLRESRMRWGSCRLAVLVGRGK